jgi:hypothetical protein
MENHAKEDRWYTSQEVQAGRDRQSAEVYVVRTFLDKLTMDLREDLAHLS